MLGIAMRLLLSPSKTLRIPGFQMISPLFYAGGADLSMDEAAGGPKKRRPLRGRSRGGGCPLSPWGAGGIRAGCAGPAVKRAQAM